MTCITKNVLYQVNEDNYSNICTVTSRYMRKRSVNIHVQNRTVLQFQFKCVQYFTYYFSTPITRSENLPITVQ